MDMRDDTLSDEVYRFLTTATFKTDRVVRYYDDTEDCHIIMVVNEHKIALYSVAIDNHCQITIATHTKLRHRDRLNIDVLLS